MTIFVRNFLLKHLTAFAGWASSGLCKKMGTHGPGQPIASRVIMEGSLVQIFGQNLKSKRDPSLYLASQSGSVELRLTPEEHWDGYIQVALDFTLPLGEYRLSLSEETGGGHTLARITRYDSGLFDVNSENE